MKQHRNRPLTGWIMLLLLAVILVAMLFGLEYLGSEKKRQIVNQPVIRPVDTEKAG